MIPGEERAFEGAFAEAASIIASMDGYLGLALQRSAEDRSKYLLLVRRCAPEDHTEGLRVSPQYERWRELLHFHDPFPTVEHFEAVEH